MRSLAPGRAAGATRPACRRDTVASRVSAAGGDGPRRRARAAAVASNAEVVRARGVAARADGAVSARLKPAAAPGKAFWAPPRSRRALQPRRALSGLEAATQDAALQATAGAPEPLGPSLPADGSAGVNFAVFSKRAEAVSLCIFADDNAKDAMAELPMQRTGDHWHLQVAGLPRVGAYYGFRVKGPSGWGQGDRFDARHVLLDPYAPLMAGRSVFADRSRLHAHWRSTFDLESRQFDWQGVQPPGHAMNDLVIYEMSVRHFTADPSSALPDARRGSYAGLVDKIPHLVALGVNAVELLPVFEYDELEFARLPNPRQHLVNAWGYSTISFFAPMSRFGSGGAGAAAAAAEFKLMVRELHRAGIEVLLDVVYNHTAEGDDTEPYTLCYRGLDNQEYYMMNRPQGGSTSFMNFSGCGNTVNANHGAARRLILDSLRHWVTEYHVDGFRFDLASALTRGWDGAPLAAPPLIRDMVADPVLARAKLIAEPWDCGGLYQVGSFPNWDRWAEWNGRYRDDVRRFIKGAPGQKAAFATRLAGSADMYAVNKRRPWASINFVVAHDGFTLRDLVSYNGKHNEANGEQGRDGSNDNESWNCGAEGAEAGDEGVRALRARQVRNFHLALMLSQGVPMMLMGDEYGHTKRGNNNTYGHDNALSWFDWGALERERDGLFRFFAEAIRFRRAHAALGRDSFLTPADVTWHEKDWANPDSRFLMFTLHAPAGSGSPALLAAFNAHAFAIDPLSLPPPPAGCHWSRVADTNLPPPRDFDVSVDKPIAGTYKMAPYSALLLQALAGPPPAPAAA